MDSNIEKLGYKQPQKLSKNLEKNIEYLADIKKNKINLIKALAQEVDGWYFMYIVV